ncbi:MAG: hypothetical protein CMJ48_13475 [Planctomycetaceae bacterium]|nr:hypothetical protein [Planctomycetaceae bacterium]
MTPSRLRCLCVLLPFFFLTVPTPSKAADWPMWRHNPGRTAQTAKALPVELHLQWKRTLPALEPAYRNERLQFDAGYEPIVQGQTLFLASSANDSVTAYDARNGERKWRFFADGPVRFAPVAWQDRVVFGSDDGYVYCLDAEQGTPVWKFRAVPSNRKILGNGQLISVWPVRGGPVIDDGVLYFAAGVWSFEGVFVYALDARTGKLRWLNDRTGYIYGQHPHATEAFGGITPQGYLVVAGDELIVPCGSALPARFDRKTGALKSFELPKAGRSPGGWFTAQSRARRRGEDVPATPQIVLDAAVNTDRHENGRSQGPGAHSVRSTIQVGERTLSFADGFQGLNSVHSIVVAHGRAFVTTLDGTLACFGPEAVSPKTYAESTPTRIPVSQAVLERAALILKQADVRHGYCLVWGVGDGELLTALTQASDMHVIGIDPDAERINKLRRTLDESGQYGGRLRLLVGTPHACGLPPYLASLIVCEEVGTTDGQVDGEYLAALFDSLRPFGGTAWIALPDGQSTTIQESFAAVELSRGELKRTDGALLLRRVGALVGSTNYAGEWSSPDELVAAPLGVLWYDDAVGNFKRAPQPKFVDGVMISHDKSWMGYPDGDRPPYALKPAVYSDVYTGRVLSKPEVARQGDRLPTLDIGQKQLSQYRPPQQKDDWKPEQPVVGRRINPLTGRSEPRAIVKAYGCDGGNDYGLLFTVRSGTAAFYDKRTESGTIHISGPRSGCTNSIIPANGLLNVPYYFQGCTCSYPLPVGLAMVALPPEHEQWTVWGPSETDQIERVGINLGAPGDRTTKAGTLWIDVPSVGGPSPDVSVEMTPNDAHPFYRHSLWIEGGRGWPWVAASGVEGVRSLTIGGLKTSKYTVRLYFAEPQRRATHQRVFDVVLQGTRVLNALNVAKEAGGPMRSFVKEFSGINAEGAVTLAFTPRQGLPILSGVELIAEGLKPGPLLQLKDVPKLPGQ